MADQFATLEILPSGDMTVVSFGGRDILNQVNIAACREQIIQMVKASQSKTIAFDLAGVRFIPSGMLGLLASLRDVVQTIQIWNPSDDVREVLEVTNLNQLFEIREGKPCC
jgi:anti-anti-sigma factor